MGGHCFNLMLSSNRVVVAAYSSEICGNLTTSIVRDPWTRHATSQEWIFFRQLLHVPRRVEGLFAASVFTAC